MCSPVAQCFGANLRHLRRHAGLNQAALGRRVELHRSEIGLLERGLRLPRLDTIVKLSAGAEASLCSLLAGLRWRPGYYVEGEFLVDDVSEPPVAAERGAL
jgi:transcriptional regulator with XRE-family HTH domain